MQQEIDCLVSRFEQGRVSRRHLVASLAALVTAASTRAQAQSDSTFQAVGLNHIALSVPDVARSRDFYVRHLGLEVTRDSPGSCFLNCGDNFVALFRQQQAGLNHYCYAISDFDVRRCAARLAEHGIESRISGNRIYFDDPDGIEVQLSAADHRA